MPSCLGLYIENNLIKYAKVSKDNEAIKVESFGVKFYENMGIAIKQIIEETYSFKVPISINAIDEIYNEIEVFGLLNKKDIDSVIKTEFEHICYEKDINKNIYEQRYILTNSERSNEKIKAIHIALPKTIIEQRKNQFLEYKISNVFPTTVAMANLLEKGKKETALIVNIEKDTSITKVVNGVVANIDIIDTGAKEILDKIKRKENSYSKAYEICKSSTIYTESDKDLQYEENEYLEDIMPSLFEIVSQVRKIANESMDKIEKIYITGTAAVINNIDIYFQDYLKDIRCEILKPSFINNYSKINIKDYIEVNSAIAIALQSFEKENKNINFTKESSVGKIWTKFNLNLPEMKNNNIPNKMIDSIAKFSGQYNVITITFVLITFSYILLSFFINEQLEKNIAMVDESILTTNQRIDKIKEYDKKFAYQTEQYETLISNIQNRNDANLDDKRHKDAIPNLLNKIRDVIPKNAQLTSIENTTGTHIIIGVKSPKYEQLAIFKTKLKVDEILKNVVSDTGTMQSDGNIMITIEGELP